MKVEEWMEMEWGKSSSGLQTTPQACNLVTEERYGIEEVEDEVALKEKLRFADNAYSIIFKRSCSVLLDTIDTPHSTRFEDHKLLELIPCALTHSLCGIGCPLRYTHIREISWCSLFHCVA